MVAPGARARAAGRVRDLVGPGVGRGGDAPPPPPLPAPLDVLFQPVREMLKPLPPFLADTDLKVNFRSYYFNRTKPDDTVNEAWAFGGRITYQSGWLLDTFSMGASLYGSAPLYAPEDRDGTLLLKPGQEGYYVPAEAWGALRYQEYALLKGYRQRVDQTYINPQDNRMTPNTFQGVTLGGKVSWLQYLGGYLWKIKPRNADEFISMSEQAGGGADSNDGVGLFGVRLTPLAGAADRPQQPVRGQHLQHVLRGSGVSLCRSPRTGSFGSAPRSRISARSATRSCPRPTASTGPRRPAGRACRRSTGTSPSRGRSRSPAPATPSRAPGGAFLGSSA